MTQLFTSIIIIHVVLNLVFVALTLHAGADVDCQLDVTVFCGTPFGDLYGEIYGESGEFKFRDIFRLDFIKEFTTDVFGLFFFNYEILQGGGAIVNLVRGFLILLGIGALIGFIFIIGPLIVSFLRAIPFLLMTLPIRGLM